jgi:hypothetical protein
MTDEADGALSDTNSRNTHQQEENHEGMHNQIRMMK